MRRKLNVKLLGWVVGGLLLVGAACHFLHEFQVRRNAGALLQQADYALEHEQLREAASYLNRYLAYEPGDTEALARYALTLERLADSPAAHYQAYLTLQQALRRDPDRADLRREAVALAVRLYRFDEAARDIEVLLKANPHQPELEFSLGCCQEAAGEYDKAAASLARALKEDPHYLAAYRRLADLLQDRLDRPEEAARVLDDMVAANPQTPDAYLRRAQYRRKIGSLEEAWADVRRAGELAPDQPEVLLAGAELAQARGDADAARARLEQGLKLHPKEVRLYQMLAWVDYRSGRQNEAVAWLQRGLKAAPESVDLQLSLADVLAADGNLKEAAAALARVRQTKADPAVLDCIEARLRGRQDRWAEALHLLEKSRPRLPASSPWPAQADLLLAQCYARLGDAEQQLAASRRAVSEAPSSPPARLALAAALLDLGQVGEALGELRQVAATKAPAETWPLLARALLLRNLRLPEEQRDWHETEAALARAVPGVETTVLRAEILAARGKPAEADELLAKALTERPGEARLWAARADLTLRRGERAAAADLLRQAGRQVGDVLPLRLAWLRYWVTRGGERARLALRKLAEDPGRLSPEEQARLLRAAADALGRLGDDEAAARLWGKLAARFPMDLHSRLVLLDRALERRRDEAVDRLIADLHHIEGEEGVLWRYGTDARLMARAGREDPAPLAEARKYLAEIERRRPDWPRGSLLAAALARAGGDADAAAEHYLRAVEQGESRPVVLATVARLLYDRGRYGQVEQVLRKAEERAPLSPDLARLGAEAARRRGDPGRAVALARQAVPPGSRDYRDHLWVAEMLAAAGRTGEAEQAIQKATQLGGNSPDPWLALVRHLAHVGSKGGAEAALEEMRRRLPVEQAPLALAQGYEALGRTDLAEPLYLRRLRDCPDDFQTLLATAEFYLHTGRPAAAEPLLRRPLDPATAAPAAVVARARRGLAVSLAAKAGEQPLHEALALLDRNRAAYGPSGEDDRARAEVLATRPDRQREAMSLLEEVRGHGVLTLAEQFLLVRLQESVGDLGRARTLLLDLLASDGRNPEYLAHYVRGLVRRGELEEAQTYLDRLKGVEPNSARTRHLDEDLRKARSAEVPPPP
jgi:tetratricopeptide (TPR) repeat protein